MDVQAYEEPWLSYTWIVVVGAIVSFGSAWSIGANDVANAFGTSVGAKTLTLWQACLIAAVFEFLGALTLGSAVTSTIAGSIARASVFVDYPEIYMYGMLCSLAAAAMWVTLATYLEYAVSTTHSIIGAVLGFALVWDGAGAIVWSDHTDEFPYSKGLVPVVISWFTSPVLSALLAMMHFMLNRTLILRRSNSTELAFWALPVLVFKTVVIDIFFILYKGAGTTLSWGPGKCGWVAAAVAGGCGALAAAILVPLLKCKLNSRIVREQSKLPPLDSTLSSPSPAPSATGPSAPPRTPPPPGGLQRGAAGGSGLMAEGPPLLLLGPLASMDETAEEGAPGGGRDPEMGAAFPPPPGLLALSQTSHGLCSVSSSGRLASKISLRLAPPPRSSGRKMTMVGMWDAVFEQPSLPSAEPPRQSFMSWLAAVMEKVKGMAMHGLVQDVHEGLEDDERVVSMHQAAEIFEPETEHVYKYLQVFSACCVSFAHGSNDTANAVGPFAGIWYAYNNWSVSTTAECPKWILAMGGAGIVLGLMTYGYNIIRALGVKMAKISPSRGYCAELAVAMTVSTASAFGLPISTTHCIVGAEVGVGLCENLVTGTNWRLFAKTATSWVATIIIAAVLSAALFSQGSYAPSIIQSRQLFEITTAAYDLSSEELRLLNHSLSMRADPGAADAATIATAAAAAALAQVAALAQRGVQVQASTYAVLMNATAAAVEAVCGLTGS